MPIKEAQSKQCQLLLYLICLEAAALHTMLMKRQHAVFETHWKYMYSHQQLYQKL